MNPAKADMCIKLLNVKYKILGILEKKTHEESELKTYEFNFNQKSLLSERDQRLPVSVGSTIHADNRFNPKHGRNWRGTTPPPGPHGKGNISKQNIQCTYWLGINTIFEILVHYYYNICIISS